MIFRGGKSEINVPTFIYCCSTIEDILFTFY